MRTYMLKLPGSNREAAYQLQVLDAEQIPGHTELVVRLLIVAFGQISQALALIISKRSECIRWPIKTSSSCQQHRVQKIPSTTSANCLLKTFDTSLTFVDGLKNVWKYINPALNILLFVSLRCPIISMLNLIVCENLEFKIHTRVNGYFPIFPPFSHDEVIGYRH